jgi:hypothetical protein
MGSVDFAVLANRFVFRFELLVFPYVRVSQDDSWTLFEDLSRFMSIEPSVPFELIFECDDIIFGKLSMSIWLKRRTHVYWVEVGRTRAAHRAQSSLSTKIGVHIERTIYSLNVIRFSR